MIQISKQNAKYMSLSNRRLELLSALDALMFHGVVSEEECKDFMNLINKKMEEMRVKLLNEESKTPAQ